MSLSPNMKPIRSKWVYIVKLHPYGSTNRYKACLVEQGYNQVCGIDYLDSFSPISKLVTFRILLALSTSKGWVLHQLDIKMPFYIDFLKKKYI